MRKTFVSDIAEVLRSGRLIHWIETWRLNREHFGDPFKWRLWLQLLTAADQDEFSPPPPPPEIFGVNSFRLFDPNLDPFRRLRGEATMRFLPSGRGLSQKARRRWRGTPINRKRESRGRDVPCGSEQLNRPRPPHVARISRRNYTYVRTYTIKCTCI